VADLYVSGLDLSTGRVVQAEEREVWQWHQKGHNGDRTLVCLECYHGAGSSDGKPQMVPLVPRGRIGGVRRRHFAHPPGMAPAWGHSPETAWHWEVKHRLCRWVRESAGASARVETWTADGRRRSDVAVTFPGGARMAIEVQLRVMTDTELLARRDDYACAGTVLIWVWHSEKRIPHVLFRFGEPGWVFDPATDRLGLACGRPHDDRPADGSTARNWSAHWPPCPGDDIEVRWMPLAGARLTESGFQPSPEVALLLQEEAAEAVRRADAERTAARSPATPCGPAAGAGNLHAGRLPPLSPGPRPAPHLALRIDARPPWSHPLARLYWCPRCGFLTGAQLQSSSVPHEIPGSDRWITRVELEP
jgi:competence protein CoiA-like protein